MQLNTSENTEYQLASTEPPAELGPKDQYVKPRPRIMSSAGRLILIGAILFSLAAGFGGGVYYANRQALSSLPVIRQIVNQNVGQPKEVDFALFWEVWNALNQKYVDPGKLDMQTMMYGAIEGMVNSVGDPYTVFFEPAVSKKFQEEISGSFGGVGIEIGMRNNAITVISPIKDSPAFKAGMKAGDKIVQVDAKSTAEMSIEEVVNLIRGKKGTEVVLTVIREGQSKSLEFKLVREAIKIPTLKWEQIGDVAYMQIYAFNQNVDSEFDLAAREILKSSSKKLIIDLRNNPGGLLDSAINLSGYFLDENQIVTMEEFRDGTREEFRSRGTGSLKAYPTLILMNGGSASASEILAGALHDNKNIQIVGEKSYGKGSVQELQNFANGSSLKVTIAKWLTPKGRSISDLGIEPTYEVKLSEEQIASGSLEFGKPGKDPQLDKAIELLK